ncbi:MAG: CpaF family protein [Acidimicrobiales bacterium]
MSADASWLTDRLVDALVGRSVRSTTELVALARRADPLLDLGTVTATVERVASWADGGLGPLTPFLDDDRVSEIMINGPGPIWIDDGSSVVETEVELTAADLDLLVERIVDPLGLRVDVTNPVVDARLADGARVNIVIPPLAVDGPTVTVRRFPHQPPGLEAFGPPSLVDLLTGLAADGANTLVVGPTAAGKTTLVGALAGAFGRDERVVTIEDTAELRLPGRHVVRLEARPANSEGVGAVGLRALVATALRMRPDRLVIGEVRGPEALDLVLALGAGHRGSIATCHGPDAAGGLRRLEALALLAPGASPSAVRALVATAIDVIVVVARWGSRRLVTDVAAVDDAGGAAPPRLRPLWSTAESRAT